MVNTDTKEMVGVECPVCHNEAFQLVKREVTIVAECCPRCAARIDYEQEGQTVKDATKAMEKKERLYFLKDKSFEWARNLHGKKVIVFWDEDKHPVHCSTESDHHVSGTAYRTTNECGGWGRVKVIIDPAEHSRISLQWTYSIEYGTGKHCPYQKPIIDGQEYGLYLTLDDDGSYYTLVSWGCRKSLVLDGKERKEDE